MKNQINEIKRMQQLAGIISESQLNELSPELLQRAGEKAQSQGRIVQANKFWGAASKQKMDKEKKDKEESLKPVKPFIDKPVNFYFTMENIHQKVLQNVEVPHTISNIFKNYDDVWIVAFAQNSASNLDSVRMMGFSMKTGFYFMDEDGWNGEDKQGRKYSIAGIDQSGAQLLVKLAKAVKPDATINANNIVNGQPTPIAGKSFKPYNAEQ